MCGPWQAVALCPQRGAIDGNRVRERGADGPSAPSSGMGFTLVVQCTNAARRRHRSLSAQSEFVERRPDSGVDVEHSDRRDVGGGWPLRSHQLDQNSINQPFR